MSQNCNEALCPSFLPSLVIMNNSFEGEESLASPTCENMTRASRRSSFYQSLNLSPDFCPVKTFPPSPFDFTAPSIQSTTDQLRPNSFHCMNPRPEPSKTRGKKNPTRRSRLALLGSPTATADGYRCFTCTIADGIPNCTLPTLYSLKLPNDE